MDESVWRHLLRNRRLSWINDYFSDYSFSYNFFMLYNKKRELKK